MVAKEIAVKKYVVKLSSEERELLDKLLRSGTQPARKLTRARVLLKADVGAGGEGWSDSQITAALGTDLTTVAPHSSATDRGRVRFRADLEAFARLGRAAHLRWRRRDQIDRPGRRRYRQVLRDYIKTTAGFEELGEATGTPSKKASSACLVRVAIRKRVTFIAPYPASSCTLLDISDDVLRIGHAHR